MITGYNTDVEHNGVVYHVQTEDKGLDSPIVLSLVYSGGAILAAKRTAYDDLIASGFQEAALVERLKRQHRLICAAINAGRIEDLRQLSKPQAERAGVDTEPAPQPEVLPAAPQSEAIEPPRETPIVQSPDLAQTLATPAAEPERQAPLPPERIAAPPATSPAEPPQLSPGGGRNDQPVPSPPASAGSEFSRPVEPVKQPAPSPYVVYDPRGRSRMGEPGPQPDGLKITLLGHDPDFHGGENIQLQAVITRMSNQVETALSGAAVSVKILGTTFRPVLLSLKTDRDGVMRVWTRIPSFTSGRAAIVVKATDHDLSTEARWVVHPGK